MDFFKQHARVLSVVLFLLLLATALWLSLARQLGDPEQELEPPAEVTAPEPPSRAAERISHPVTLLPLAFREVVAPASAALGAWAVAPNDSVSAGQTLATLNTSEVAARLGPLQAQAGVARHQVRTLRHLVADGYEPQANLDRAQQRLDTTLAEIAELEAAAQAGRVVAPVDGVIRQLLVEEGRAVEEGEVVALIAPPGPRSLRARVPAEDAQGIAPGHAARLVLGGQRIAARVVQVSSAGASSELMLELPAEVDLPADVDEGQLFLRP